MPVHLFKSLLSNFMQRSGGTISSLHEWRSRLLDGVLRGIFALWLIALAVGINNVLVEYRESGHLLENSFTTALLTIFFYLAVTALFTFITLKRAIKFELRAGLLLFILYALGTVSMVLTSFSGDGRIFFFSLIILSVVFFDLRYSLTTFVFVFLTLLVIGYLQVSGILTVPLEWQANAALPGAWISGGIVLLFMSIAALISITYLLQAFEGSLVKAREALEREQRLGQILRTVSSINQLIFRAKDSQILLNETCEQLVLARGYSFAWIGLLQPDGLSLHLAAHAGDTVNLEEFKRRLTLDEGLVCAAEAIRSRSFFLADPSAGVDPCLGCPRREKYPNRTGVSLSIQRPDRVFGVLTVDHDSPNTIFDQQEISLLRELADDLAYALEHIEASNRLNLYVRYQALLNEVTQTALEAFDLDSLLREFIRKLEKALNADGYFFALWDEARQIPAKYIYSERFNEVFSKTPGFTPNDKIFSRSILEEGRVLAVTDVLDSPFIDPGMARMFNVHSALGLPLNAGGHRIGALILGYQERHVFAAEEVELAQQAAAQFALAILKVKLNDEMRLKAAELETIFAAAQDMASSLLDPSDLLAKLARHMTDALGVTSTNITSIDLASDTMQVMAEYWNAEAAPAEVHSDLGRIYPNGDYATIMRSMIAGQAVILHEDSPDMTPIEQAQFAEYQVKSMMFVPIMSRAKLLGTVEIWESRRQREYTQSEVRLALAMAGHAATIIENSTLFSLTRRREIELGAMLTIARAVSSSLQLSDVLKQAATTLARLMRVDFCSLSDYLPGQEKIVTTALFSAEEDVSGAGDLGVEFSLADYPATHRVLLTGEPLLTRLDDPHADPAELQQLRRDGMFSSLLIPLRLRGQSLGLAELFCSNPQRIFQPEELQFARGLADQVAVAIDNARLYEHSEEREARFRALIENSTEGIAILDANGYIRYLAPSERQLTGYAAEEMLGVSIYKFIHPDDQPRMKEIFWEGVATPGAVRSAQFDFHHKNGQWRTFEIVGQNLLHDPHIAGVVVNFRDITERNAVERAMQESEERYRMIFQSAGVPIWEDDYSALIESIEALKKQGVSDFERYLKDNPDFVNRAAQLVEITDTNMAVLDMMEAGSKAELLGSLHDILKKNPTDTFSLDILALAQGKRHFEHESYLHTLKGRRRDVWISVTFPEWDTGNKRVLVTTLDITERKRAERELRDNEARLEGIINTALNAIITIDQDHRIVLFNPYAEKIFGCTAGFALGKSLDMFVPERHRRFHRGSIEKFGETNISNRNHGQTDNLYGLRANGDEFPMEAYVSQQEIGNRKFFTVILRDVTERKRAEEDLRRHAFELETLAAASYALRAAQNGGEMIPILAHHALRAVNGDYASFFLLDESSNEFVSRGWYSLDSAGAVSLPDESILRHEKGAGITGRVAETGEIYTTLDIQKDPVVLFLAEERKRLKDVHGGISLPLHNPEKTIGVMHVWCLQPRIFTDTEIRLLTALAETAGNAIHRANLFEKTQKHAEELAQAYDNTLAGWARALELRDELTEGHTRRVTELTLKLAKAMGVSESELVNIRRGAILHDIGKMGIPDSILNKPGPLSAQEQRIMRMHPQYAYEMLSFIPFLQPALDIPYCHHEWWNGKGYPRGLKSGEIPLAARIFAVVDVWDALTSNRPYRSAWSRESVLKYIKDGSGMQFDPTVAEAFLRLIKKR